MDEPSITSPSSAPPSARFVRVVASGGTDIGQNRQHNEDSILLRPELSLFVLADGAGGHNAGNVASALATSCVAKGFEATARSFPESDSLGAPLARRLATSIHRANTEIIGIAKSVHKYRGMGTTVVACAFSPDGQFVHVAHVGDSRCYRLRGGMLETLTLDHSLLNDVLELRPDLPDDAIAKLPRSVVTRALGMEESLRVSVRSLRVAPGDRYLLCSDGLWDALDDDAIAETLSAEKTPEELTRALIDAALFCGADDNIGVVVIACEAAAGAPERPARKKPAKKAPPPLPEMRPMLGSAPEIVIVNVEDAADEPIVVPADSASPSLLDAFAGLRKKRAPQE